MGAPRDLEMIFTQDKSKDGMAQFVKIVVADTQLSTVEGSQQTVTDGGDKGAVGEQGFILEDIRTSVPTTDLDLQSLDSANKWNL